MSINQTSAIQRTAFVGTCFLIGAAALTACGDTADVATVSAAPSAYVSPEQTDRAAQLALQANHVATDPIVRPVVPYVSPEQTDRAAQLALRADHAPAAALDRRATESTSAYASAEDFVRRGVESAGAQASVDALERRAIIKPTSAHASADALEQWAINAATSTSAHPSADALEHWAMSEGEG
jgi:hypothetical protein